MTTAHLTVTTEAQNGSFDRHESDDFLAFWKLDDGTIVFANTNWSERDVVRAMAAIAEVVEAEAAAT